MYLNRSRAPFENCQILDCWLKVPNEENNSFERAMAGSSCVSDFLIKSPEYLSL